MALVKVEIEVSKESYELGQGIAAVVKAALVAGADGWQLGTDLPAIAVSAFGQLAAIQGVDQIKAEMDADPAAFGKAIMMAVSDIYAAVQENKAVEPA